MKIIRSYTREQAEELKNEAGEILKTIIVSKLKKAIIPIIITIISSPIFIIIILLFIIIICVGGKVEKYENIYEVKQQFIGEYSLENDISCREVEEKILNNAVAGNEVLSLHTMKQFLDIEKDTYIEDTYSIEYVSILINNEGKEKKEEKDEEVSLNEYEYRLEWQLIHLISDCFGETKDGKLLTQKNAPNTFKFINEMETSYLYITNGEGDYKAIDKAERHDLVTQALLTTPNGENCVRYTETITVKESWSSDWKEIKNDKGEVVGGEWVNTQQNEPTKEYKLEYQKDDLLPSLFTTYAGNVEFYYGTAEYTDTQTLEEGDEYNGSTVTITTKTGEVSLNNVVLNTTDVPLINYLNKNGNILYTKEEVAAQLSLYAGGSEIVKRIENILGDDNKK